jgi:hypothetical protein
MPDEHRQEQGTFHESCRSRGNETHNWEAQESESPYVATYKGKRFMAPMRFKKKMKPPFGKSRLDAGTQNSQLLAKQ